MWVYAPSKRTGVSDAIEPFWFWLDTVAAPCSSSTLTRCTPMWAVICGAVAAAVVAADGSALSLKRTDVCVCLGVSQPPVVAHLSRKRHYYYDSYHACSLKCPHA